MVFLTKTSSLKKSKWKIAFSLIFPVVFSKLCYTLAVSDNKKKIFIVDDDAISLEVAAMILGEAYEVTTVMSGKAGLDLLVHHYKPDLILLDIIMPEMDGWETYNKIRGISLLHEVPIVFLTSLASPEGQEQAKHMGAADYITKPLDKANLLGRIGKILNP